ncbi:hypothetical protein FE359_04100 [Helicobacter pylori]|uniref:hypothetical protein n=1 Tax=Helicobacter pylori TaxID=210 RepID=UPI000FDED6A4|nr:hypothetical protein [Helicobacter pylori]RVZ10832.1 hypothetical protein EC526_01590 [Helicobacter pylori]WQW95825.1 hypothetical protein FE359_04100 [Helicobacter pylori]
MKNLALFLLSVGYKKILHFLRLDSKELDFIQAVFFKAFFRMDFSCRGEYFKIPLISLREWV